METKTKIKEVRAIFGRAKKGFAEYNTKEEQIIMLKESKPAIKEIIKRVIGFQGEPGENYLKRSEFLIKSNGILPAEKDILEIAIFLEINAKLLREQGFPSDKCPHLKIGVSCLEDILHSKFLFSTNLMQAEKLEELKFEITKRLIDSVSEVNCSQ